MTSPSSPEDVEDPAAESRADFPLQAHISPRLAASWPHILVAGFFGFLFLFGNHLPLFFSDLWGHVSYGRWILDNGRLPTEDPFVPLAAGMQIVDSAWLGQVIFAAIHGAGGPELLSFAFAVTVTLTYLILFLAYFQRAPRAEVALLTTAIVLALAFSRILVMRTEILASLACAALLLVMGRLQRSNLDAADSRPPWSAYLLLPIIMAFWANVHDSFVVGLVILWCGFLGKAVSECIEAGGIRGMLSSRGFRCWLILCEVATAAILVNPYGIDLPLHVLAFTGNPNLASNSGVATSECNDR